MRIVSNKNHPVDADLVHRRGDLVRPDVIACTNEHVKNQQCLAEQRE
jgi:hypothetical protein